MNDQHCLQLPISQPQRPGLYRMIDGYSEDRLIGAAVLHEMMKEPVRIAYLKLSLIQQSLPWIWDASR